MKKLILLILGLSFSWLGAQNYNMTAANHGVTFYTCSGNFYDDGGPNGNYANGINNRTMTFCPMDPDSMLRFNFLSFHTETNYDRLEVFYGPDATGSADETYTGNVPPFTLFSNGPGGCITFRFKSDNSINYAGWHATIACVEPCNPPTAAMVDMSAVDLCPTEAVNGSDLTVEFDGSASTAPAGFGILKYIWNFGDGTIVETDNPVISHTFSDGPGYYGVTLRVRSTDTGTDPDGCMSANFVERRVRVLPPPDFSEMTESPVVIDCGDSVTLSGVAASQTIAQKPPKGSGSDVVLPDTLNTPFESVIDMTGFFPPGAEVTASCLPQITFNIEHSYAGDLKISLIAPSGESALLMDGYGNGPGSGNMGYVLLGYCVNGLDNGVPGCTAPYHIVNSGGLDWHDSSTRTNYTQTCAVYNGPCEIGYTPNIALQNVNYNASEPLTNFIGAELNGEWTLRIVDYWGLDDGFLDGWVLSFPGQCYTSLDFVTPILEGGAWSNQGDGPPVPGTQTVGDDPWITIGIDQCPGEGDCVGNILTNDITVGPFEEPGSYFYVFSVEDEFGCTYEKEVEVIVEPVELKFDLEDTYCLYMTPEDLPDLSLGGYSGSWEPSEIDTSVLGTSYYTFTADDSCALPYVLEINITELIEPVFLDIVTTYCIGQEPEPFLTTSNNGFTGQWEPSEIDTSEVGTTVYTFIPDPEQCSDTLEVTIEITPLEIAHFNLSEEYCQFEDPELLPNISMEDFTGSWEPAVIDTSAPGTYFYTFTPDDECVDEFVLEVNIEEKLTPDFLPIDPMCINEIPPALPDPENGIPGTWFPSTIDTSQPGIFEYTFTPFLGVCAFEVTIEVEITDEILPVFDFPESYCQWENPETLPGISDNGVSGSWYPATIDTSVPGPVTYVFTPDETEECALVTTAVVVIYEELKLNELPVQAICDVNFDGVFSTNLNLLNIMLSAIPGVSYQYYASLSDLQNGNAIPASQVSNYAFPSLPWTIYAVGTSPDGCPSEAVPVYFEQEEDATHAPGVYGPIDYCKEDTVDLTEFEGDISWGNVNFSYFNSLPDAQFQVGQILNIHEYQPELTNGEIIIVRIDEEGRCPAFVEIVLNVLPTPGLELPFPQLLLCEGDVIEVTATSDDPNATFEWHMADGSILEGATQYIDMIGEYTVIAFSADGCRSEPRTLVVTHPAVPVITGIEFHGDTVIIFADNFGQGYLEYSIDGFFWQNSNEFLNLVKGQTYTVYVRSNGCMIAKYEFTLLDIPNFISPNDDGKNDTWQIRGIDAGSGATIQIFDRSGKKFVDTDFSGNFEWDGKYMGSNVASGDYWYIIHVPGNEIIMEQKFVGHISVRNQ